VGVVSLAFMKASITKVRSVGGVEEYRLGNGLRLLFKRVSAAPVVAVCVTYHVGSRNEAKGHTGSTHILEHLMFKDSKEFNKANGKAVQHYLEWFGANWNATTWLDRTNYFEILPKEKLEEAVALEADRMRNAQFSAEDLASEMTVVRNEYERGRNNPFELLDEALWGKAYTRHPYRIPTIGTKEDIEGSTVEKLREFYNTFYWPNNATLMVAGDVPFATVKKLVLKYFGPIPRSPHPIHNNVPKEPPQTGPRSVVIKKPIGVSIAQIFYKIGRARDKDFAATLVLATILGGGFSSRLQRALVDTGLAADISAITYALFDPGVLSLTAHVAEGAEPAGALLAIRRETRRLAKAGIIPEELARAKERILSQFAAERDGVLNEARIASEAIAAGEWRLAYTIESAVKKLTVAQVNRAAKKYLTSKGETSGLLINK